MRIACFVWIAAVALGAAIGLSACTGVPVRHAFPVIRDPGGCDLEVLALDSGRAPFQFAGLSPDQRQLVIGWESTDAANPGKGSYLLDLQTGETLELPVAINNAGSFSPDGRRIVAAAYNESGRTDIVELDVATTRVRPITSDPAWDFLPTYFPAGDKILFNSYRTGGSDIYAADLVTGTLERLTDDPRYEAHAQLSPDERHIAFVRKIGPADYDVVIRDIETGAERTLAPSPREESYPAWSPDGRQLVISSDRDSEPGSNNLYLLDADGRGMHRLTHHPANDSYATWSADGGSIIFVSQRDGHGVYRLHFGHDHPQGCSR